MGKPLGATFIGIAIVVLLIGVNRSASQYPALRNDMIGSFTNKLRPAPSLEGGRKRHKQILRISRLVIEGQIPCQQRQHLSIDHGGLFGTLRPPPLRGCASVRLILGNPDLQKQQKLMISSLVIVVVVRPTETER